MTMTEFNEETLEVAKLKLRGKYVAYGRTEKA